MKREGRSAEPGIPTLRRAPSIRARENLEMLADAGQIENTVRYLGVDVKDALELAEATEV
ncbi:hypothetical protein [Aminobacter sp. MSH1]|uniref:hypothetical protein n=1 Tax=Aminobacter sp. MSH1 TaxID=374606 RepID=UPI0019021521|nr:hypothetical protein [Aminobacter sp. MSH1]